MSISQVIESSISWLAWTGLVLATLTMGAFIINWGAKYRLIGATIFTFLLSASCWAFNQSYQPPITVEGYKYVPIVYDNGYDLVVAQAPNDFPHEAIEPTLMQVAGNLKGGKRNGALVKVLIRTVKNSSKGFSTPIIIGEASIDSDKKVTVKVITETDTLDIENEEPITKVISTNEEEV